MSDFNTRIEFFVGLTTKSGEALSGAHACGVVASILSVAGVDGFNVVRSAGYWKGQRESSLVVTVLANQGDLIVDVADAVAAGIAVDLEQECVLVSVTGTRGTLVYPAGEDEPAAPAKPTGHAGTGGLQKHSVGGDYPYTLVGGMAAGPEGPVDWRVMHCITGEMSARFPTIAEARAHLTGLKAGR